MISPLEAARAAASIDLPIELAHTLVVLALFWPDIRPTQEQLARLLHRDERTVRDRLKKLEHLGLITRTRGGTHRATVYHINLRRTVESVSPRAEVWTSDQEQLSTSTTEQVDGVDEVTTTGCSTSPSLYAAPLRRR